MDTNGCRAFSIQVPQELYKKIVQLAEAGDRSLNAPVVRLLRRAGTEGDQGDQHGNA
jgi:hypothetical protein